MSNYTLAVAWSGKDALSDSDAAKVISGSDFNTEFTAVQTAVNTKADINGSASEAFSATTATAGTNTTQVATTAFTTTALALKANLASPTFTGVPAAPTAAVDTNTTQVATTAFTKAQIADTFSYASGVLTITTT
jgi:hypothetical protein